MRQVYPQPPPGNGKTLAIWLELDEVDRLSRPIRGRGGHQTLLRSLAGARHGQVQFVSPVNRNKVLSYAWDYGEGSFQNRIRSLALKLLAAEASGEFLVPEELLPAVDDVA